MEEFKLEGKEFIELNKLLKIMKWVDTGGEANMRIEYGEVMVNGEVEYRKRNKLRAGFVVELEGKKVSVI